MEEEKFLKMPELERMAGILPYLSVPTLLRCRCLSSWHKSKIDDPHFSNIYTVYSGIDSLRYFRIFLQFYRPPAAADAAAESLDICLFSRQPNPGQVFQVNRYLNAFFVGSCLGILCLAYDPFDVRLWNPSTRTHRHLIMPNCQLHDRAYRRVSFGLGCDTNRNVKLVRLVFTFSPAARAFVSEASVYTIRTDTWQTFNCDLTLPANSFVDEPQELQDLKWHFINGGVSVIYIVNWVIRFDANQSGVAQFRILSLNLDDYRIYIRTIPERVMEGRTPESLKQINLLPFYFEDCLSLHFGGESPGVVIWDKKMGMWTKFLSIQGSFSCFRPLRYSPNKTEVLLQIDKKLVWYEFQTGKYWSSDILQDGFVLDDATVYMDSSVSIK